MKKVYISVISIFTLGFLIFTSCGYFFAFEPENVNIQLNGDTDITLGVYNSYNDFGITFTSNNEVVSRNKYILRINNPLDNTVLGNYTIDYEINYKNKDYNISRNITVIDEESPVITLSSDTVTMDYCSKKIKKPITFTAYDNYDKDITDKVEVITKSNSIIYKVIDSSGNVSENVANIIYQKKPNNTFKLNGSKKMYVTLNSTFNDPGVTYKDGCGKELKNELIVSGEVDTSVEGTYFIFYKIEGEKTLSREVIVNEKTTNNKKTIYLTFDDGPGATTQKILDTLDKYNIKATFFVTHQFPAYIDLIGEEYRRGHTIAVHTYTHNYKTVYSTVDGYVSDFNKMNELVKYYTGSYSLIFRFPGGSSNTVSRQYAKGIVTAIAKRMIEDGYFYWDWNVDSQDAAGANAQRVYNEVLKGVEKCSNCVVLMHDIKSATATALDDILKSLTEKGYTFKTLTTTSPKVRHHINN